MADRSGLTFSSDSALVRRAVERVEQRPVPATTLARDVLGIDDPPPELAHELVEALLGGHHRVVYEAGRWRLRERERTDDVPLDELDYVVVDLETTGTSPGRGHRVTEIAAVEVSEGGIAGEFSTLVDPGRPIPPGIQQLTGITDRMVADAPPFEEVTGLVRERLEGRIFVAHNVPFDWRFLSREMRRAGEAPPQGPRLCTLRFARRALPELPGKGLDAVARHYGVAIEGRHRAAGDALAAASILLRLLEDARERGLHRWGALKRWLGGGPLPDPEGEGETC